MSILLVFQSLGILQDLGNEEVGHLKEWPASAIHLNQHGTIMPMGPIKSNAGTFFNTDFILWCYYPTRGNTAVTS